jgi:hypothetical protein
MTPTCKLRFVEREKLSPYEFELGKYITQTKTVRILQQWWEKSLTINLGWTGDMPLRKAEGEWRDVPLEEEQA